MAYFAKTNRLNMRRVPSGYGEYVGVGGVTDVLESIGSGALNLFATTEQQKGALAAQQALLQQQAAQNQGMDTSTILIIGLAAAAGIFLVLRK